MQDIDSVPSNVYSARQEALLYVFEDNEAVIKMIMKGRSPTMRHVSRTHRVALDWLFDRINLDSKIQIKYIDTKNQLADILTKGNFSRDEWNHLLSLFNISHFSSTACTAAMAKRAQQESGEERVTAKSRPMMNLTARMPSVVLSSTSSSLVKRWYGNQDPWNLLLQMIDQRNLINSPQQVVQNWIMVVLGLLKSGKVSAPQPTIFKFGTHVDDHPALMSDPVFSCAPAPTVIMRVVMTRCSLAQVRLRNSHASI